MKLNSNDFWQYSLSVYKNPEMSENALILQDEYGVNVNMLLLLCWCVENGVIITLNQWQMLKAAIAEVEQALVIHRRKRRAEKTENGDSSRYADMKAKELELEAEQQRELVTTLDRLPYHTVSMKGINGGVAAFVHAFTLRDNPQAVQCLTRVLRCL